jgi:hypothetical protein
MKKRRQKMESKSIYTRIKVLDNKRENKTRNSNQMLFNMNVILMRYFRKNSPINTTESKAINQKQM